MVDDFTVGLRITPFLLSVCLLKQIFFIIVSTLDLHNRIFDCVQQVLQNCDELFEREELSAAPDVGWPDCFNSGVFVFKPSNETFKALYDFAITHGSFDGIFSKNQISILNFRLCQVYSFFFLKSAFRWRSRIVEYVFQRLGYK